MTIQFKALPTDDVRALQRGGPDAKEAIRNKHILQTFTGGVPENLPPPKPPPKVSNEPDE